MEVTFIGSGNLAWHLAPALDNTDYHVREVYSMNPSNAEALVRRLYHAAVRTTLDFRDSRSQIFIVAVPDDAIVDVVEAIMLPENAILVHTSGSQPMDALAHASTPKTGVFYPLQTFSKNRKVDFNEIHVFVEGSQRDVEKVLLRMARSVSRNVVQISSSERRILHIAAVFASNFTNHMLTIAHDITSTHKLNFEWLKPLIAETINKSLTLGPEASQTGPARRGDLETLDRHMEFLKGDEAIAEIYRVISQHLVDRYTS